jgi:hypothetical protein
LFRFVSKNPSWNFGIFTDGEASYIDMGKVFKGFLAINSTGAELIGAMPFDFESSGLVPFNQTQL